MLNSRITELQSAYITKEQKDFGNKIVFRFSSFRSDSMQSSMQKPEKKTTHIHTLIRTYRRYINDPALNDARMAM